MANKVTITTPGPAGPSGLTWKNQWAASTGYSFRDVVRYAVNGNLYFCTVAHTSGTIVPTNISYWNLFVDNTDSFGWATTAKHTLFTDSTGTSEYSSKHYALKSKDWASLTTDAVTNNADSSDEGYSAKAWAIGGTEVSGTASRGAAKEWATKTDGAVDTADHSAKAWSIGGTGVTTTASKGASKEWAIKIDGAVDTADHSSKAWAIGGTGVTDTASKGAAKEWAIETTGTVDGTSYSAKEYAQGTQASTGGSAKDYAQKTDGGVSGATSDHSAKAWAVGGTGVTTTASKGAAKEWATTTGGQVDTNEYSAKEWAVGTTVPSGASKEWATNAGSAEVATGQGYSAKAYAQDDSNDIGSAKDWATKAGSAQVTSSDYSAKAWASDTANNIGSSKDWATKAGSAQVASSDYSAKAWAQNTANNIGSAKDWATKTDAVVASSDGSAKAWAVGGTGVTDTASKGAAKEWATETASTVDTSEYSAKEYAVGTQRRGQANGGSAKDWATYTSGTVDNASYSALYHANAASESALAAKNSAAAVANVYDNFADTFLGSMADGATASSGSANGTWAVNSSSITLASTSGTIEVGQEVTGSGIPTDANVLTVDGSTITISENMAAAGSSVALTFTGQGVYGAFDSSSDGPSTDNDGDALVTGALYFNTTDNAMRIYDGANWIAASASGSTSFLIYKYVATSSQTTFTGADANGASLSYTTNNILVFLNGVKLDATDFTATSGTSVVLGSPATTSDELVIVSFKSFTTADMVPASTGGTFAGNVTFGADIQINGGDIKDANGNESIKIVSTTNAVNELTVTNAATGNATTLSATGTDTDIDLTLSPKGSGEVNISKVDIDAGTIDGATIATSDITVGSSKTLDVSAGTLTTSTAQKQAIIDGADIEGTAVISTGETGGTKFLREDGDGTCSWQTNDAFPSGTKMLFHQTSAPTGWTKVTTTGTGSDSINDVGLRIVTGTITDGVAGSVAFDTAFASQTIPTHQLTVNEMPAHNHTVVLYRAHGSANTNLFGNGNGGYYSTGSGGQMNNTGGNQAHGHGSIDLDVKYIDLIVASKD